MVRIGRCKVVVVGDGAVGKTCLLTTFLKREFPINYVPTIIDNFTATLPVRKEDEIELTIWDTAGQEDWEQLRLLAYKDADVAMICYSTISASSLVNVEQIWMPEIKNIESNPCNVLVGTKLDLKAKFSEDAVPIRAAREVAERIKSFGVKECSAIHFENEKKGGVKGVFALAVSAYMNKLFPPKKARKFCTTL